MVAQETPKAIAARFGLGASACRRHKEGGHISERIQEVQAAREEAQALDVVTQLRAVNTAAWEVLKQARESKDGELLLKAADRVLRQLVLQAKLLGDLGDDAGAIPLHLHPEYRKTRDVILAALAPHPAARAAVVEALMALGGGK